MLLSKRVVEREGSEREQSACVCEATKHPATAPAISCQFPKSQHETTTHHHRSSAGHESPYDRPSHDGQAERERENLSEQTNSTRRVCV